MSSLLYESLCIALLRAGVSPRYVRRYRAELSDHYHVAVEEHRSAGLTYEEAAAQARKQLGDQDMLFRSVMEHPAVLAFARRRSAITFCFLPIVALIATKGLIVLASGLAGILLRSSVYTVLEYGAPLVVAFLFCNLARRRGCRPLWPLLSAVLIALVAGCCQFELRRSMLDLGAAHVGVGAFSFSVTPVVLVPLLVCVLFRVYVARGYWRARYEAP